MQPYYENIVRALPAFDAIYLNKQHMEDEIETTDVALGRCAFIHYDASKAEAIKYNQDEYNNTVWQKIYDPNKGIGYEQIADWDPITNQVFSKIGDSSYPTWAVTYVTDPKEGQPTYTFTLARDLAYVEVNGKWLTLSDVLDGFEGDIDTFKQSISERQDKVEEDLDNYFSLVSPVMITRWDENDTWSNISAGLEDLTTITEE